MIVESTDVDDLDISSSELIGESVTVIQKLVKKMKRLVLSDCKLTQDQQVVLFRSISESHLDELSVNNINLSNLDPDSFNVIQNVMMNSISDGVKLGIHLKGSAMSIKMKRGI